MESFDYSTIKQVYHHHQNQKEKKIGPAAWPLFNIHWIFCTEFLHFTAKSQTCWHLILSAQQWMTVYVIPKLSSIPSITVRLTLFKMYVLVLSFCLPLRSCAVPPFLPVPSSRYGPVKSFRTVLQIFLRNISSPPLQGCFTGTMSTR